MAKKDFGALAQAVIENVGGKENIATAAHCMTRLRFTVKDRGLVNTAAVNSISGVAGSQWVGDQYQIIIGQSVSDAYSAVCRQAGISEQGAIDENLDGADKKKRNPLIAVCDGMSGTIVPVIPLFMASGLVKVILVLANLVGILSKDSSTYNILSQYSDAALYFLPIIVACTAAKKFRVDAGIAMGLCGLLVYPSFMATITGETAATLYGIPVYAGSYTNMIFPSILIVFVMSYVERFWKKVIPEVLKTMMVPLLTTLVMLPLSVCVLAPAGAVLGSGITWAVEFLYNKIGFLGYGVLSALYPALIVTGMHSALTPVIISNFTQYGYDPMMAPANHIANFNQAAAAFAVFVKSKKADVKGVAGSSALTAFLAGITEPALFGVNFRYRTPLIASMIGGFFGGCYAGIMGCKLMAISGTGVLALTGFIADDPMNLIHFVIALVIAMVITFALTMIFYKDKEEN